MKGQIDIAWAFGLIIASFTVVALATAYWTTHNKGKTKIDLEAEIDTLKKESSDLKSQLSEAKDEIKINRRKINKIIERFIEKSSF